MRILVTGGSGLIGRALLPLLTDDGHEVVVLSRSPGEVTGLPAGARAVGWDAETPEGWSELVDGDTGIVHLAGENVASGRWTEEKKRRIRDSRVRSSRAVKAAIERSALGEAKERPRFLVQASAVGYYGDRDDERLTEDSDPGDDFLARVSLEWEGATEGVEELGVRRVLIRTGVVLAEDEGALPKMALPFKLFIGGPLGDGSQYVPWIHLDDEVAAIRFLIAREDASGPFNLAAPTPVTNRELSKAIASALGRPCLFGLPKTVLHLTMGEMAEMLLASQRVLPERLERAGFEFAYPRVEPALDDLLG